MKNKVITTKNSSTSCIGYNEKWLMISSEALHTNFESLSEHIKSFHKSGTNGYSTITLDAIKEIEYHANYQEFFIRYKTESLKLKKYYFSIEKEETRTNFCDDLAQSCSLNSKKEYPNPYAKLWSNFIIISLTLFLTWVITLIAKGGMKGSNRALRQSVADLMQIIGPRTFTVIGLSIAAYFLYKTIKNFIKPGKTIIYT